MREHDRLIRSEDIFIIMFLIYLVVRDMLRRYRVVPLVFETVLTVVDVVFLGGMVYVIVRLFLKIGL
jgi:hypothetical protein